MSWIQTLPSLGLIVICLTAGGLLREQVAGVYYGKPKPFNVDPFTKLLLWRDLQVLEERKREQEASS
eukprot:jgi/Chrzof1/14010/Cz08g21010.t1